MSTENRGALRVTLRDPNEARPSITLLHRYERRLFLKASYLQLTATIPGAGPEEEGELAFRFRGWFSKQRGSVRWKDAVPGGDQWLSRLEQPLLRAIKDVEAVQSLSIRWSPKNGVWRVRLETLSGSMMSGITSFLPIAVPFDRKEAEGVLALIDTLSAVRS